MKKHNWPTAFGSTNQGMFIYTDTPLCEYLFPTGNLCYFDATLSPLPKGVCVQFFTGSKTMVQRKCT